MVRPVVSVTGEVVWEWFGVWFDGSSVGELVGVDMEEVEVATGKEGTTCTWARWMEKWLDSLNEGL